uniref:Uncharacterized protein n=1 Tax=viral metagenome TaxID=1070528 RepID=A0A6C0HZY1_9ZZZZ
MKKNNKIIIFILIIIIILFLYLSIKKENYKNNSYDKTVCIVWQNKINKEHHHGFGDKLRGLIKVYQYCKKNNINFKIDATNDMCGDFLKNISNKYYNNEELFIELQWNRIDHVEEIITNKLLEDNVVYIYTNGFYNDELDNNDKEYLKYLLEPIDSLKIEIDEKIKKLPENYGIQHVRFKDEIFDNDTNEEYNTALEFIKSNYKPTDVLITNSSNFKKFAKDNINISVIECENNCNVGHIGQSNDYENIKNSFIDFFIICNSKYINSINFYGGSSGFVNIPSKIYDIPFSF